MDRIDKQYTDLLQDILDNGVKKETRNGETISVFGRQIRHDMKDGFPLLTTKKMPFKAIVTELLWFLRGDTNIKYLVDNDCHIWDGDAYKRFALSVLKAAGGIGCVYVPTREEFINKIKTDDKFAKQWGELGPIYGKQWRMWGTGRTATVGHNGLHTLIGEEVEDQIQNLINELKTDPDSRRLMVNAWNVGELDQMFLPPCHYGFQVYTRELSYEERNLIYKNKFGETVEDTDAKWELNTTSTFTDDLNEARIPTRAISLMWNQRSVDTFLGLPFNIASYGLLLEIIAKEVNMVPDQLIGNLGDVHLYSNHIEQAKEQIGRELNLDERADLHPTPDMFYDIHGTFYIGDSIEESTLPYEDREWLHKKFDEGGISKRTREPFPLPTLKIEESEPSIIEKPQYWKPTDFIVENYQSHPTIKAPLSN